MDFNTNVLLLVLLLSVAKSQVKNESVEDLEGKTRELFSKQTHATQELINQENMVSLFINLYESLTKNLTGNHLATLYKLETINTKLDSLHVKIIQIERNQEELSFTISQIMNENIGKISINTSGSFKKDLLRNESLVLDNFESNYTLPRNHDTFSHSVTNISESQVSPNTTNHTWTPTSTAESRTERVPFFVPPTPTELSLRFLSFEMSKVEEVNILEGTIQFSGGANSALRRKIWVLQSEGSTHFLDMTFNLEENHLGPNAHLSLWGSGWDDPTRQHVWNATQRDWREERESLGNVILVTLVISSSAREQPSFKLKFRNSGRYGSGGLNCSSQVVHSEGRHVVSYPTNNTESFSLQSLFVALIAPPNGELFELTLTYMDLPGTPPDLCENKFYIWFLEESPAGGFYKRLNSCDYRRCGSVGNISEPIANAVIAILWFHNSDGLVGRGFRVHVN